VFRVNRVDLALETSFQEVFEDGAADRSLGRGRAHEGYRFGFEKLFER
jgi:hypothetical protein